MVNDFFYLGRDDCLGKRSANPGAGTPKERRDYMKGYNSVKQQGPGYDTAFKEICEIIENSRAMQSKEGLTFLLSKILIKSLDEPADTQTETDSAFKNYLNLLEKYDSLDLKMGFAKLYNAVQRSKRFQFREGELTKQLKRVEPVEKPKKKPKKN